jgi:SAM-dependent methyltransferase
MSLCGQNCAAAIPMIPRNAVEASRLFLAPGLDKAGCVIDATAGNGHDVLFLCKQTRPDCRVWAFDVQAAAIATSEALLNRHGFREKARLIHNSHAKIEAYIREPVDAAIFNLGYLPGHNHTVTTDTEALAAALAALRILLAPGGRLAIVAYPGHEPGRREVEFLESHLSGWPQQDFTISRLCFINQKNKPAILYSIGKMGRQQHENTSPG